MALLFGGGGGFGGSSSPAPGHSTLQDRSDSVATLPGSLQSIPSGPSCHHRLHKYFKRLYRRLGLNHLIPLLLVVVYTVIGGGLFLALERGNDVSVREASFQDYLAKRRELEERIVEISRAEFASSEAKARTVAEAVDWFEAGIGFSISPDSIWDFWSACYFSGTLYTTIGYGNIACVTAGGRVATMIYALIGIPIVLTALNDLGKWLFKTIQYGIERWATFKAWCLLQYRLHQARRRVARKGVANIVIRLEIPGSDDPVEIPIERTATDPSIDFDPERADSDDTDDLVEELIEEVESEVPKIPVSVALGVTVGWIFLISAMFLLWETNWTFSQSIYFFFISLSTIGLGDVVPEHPGYMVMNFGFVIVGLSLVSMSINVIQQKLEELYLQLLLLILKEYQHQLASGDGQVNATMGMMQSWNNNATAKLLMPLLSGSKKQSVMAELHKEAKAQGIPVPPILSSLDAETGLPSIFKAEADEAASPPLPLAAVIMGAIKEADEEAAAVAADVPAPVVPHLYTYEADTQTELSSLDDTATQTTTVDSKEDYAQTSWSQMEFIEESAQTVAVDCEENDTQTHTIDHTESDSQTPVVGTTESGSQSHLVEMKTQELQTHLYENVASESQTETAESINKRLQTHIIETAEMEVQTDPTAGASKVRFTQPKANFGMAARRRIRKAFGKRKSSKSPSSTRAGSSRGDEVEEDEEEVEDEFVTDEEDEGKEVLDWDPIDGKHAEKQRTVSNLKAMFDKSKK